MVATLCQDHPSSTCQLSAAIDCVTTKWHDMCSGVTTLEHANSTHLHSRFYDTNLQLCCHSYGMRRVAPAMTVHLVGSRGTEATDVGSSLLYLQQMQSHSQTGQVWSHLGNIQGMSDTAALLRLIRATSHLGVTYREA